MTVLTTTTHKILKNFASINNSIVIKPGSTIGTLSVNKNILAVADVEEKFEKQISIYDLSQFLHGFSFFNVPEVVTDNESYVTVTEHGNDTKKVRFYYADPDIIVQPPDKTIVLPSVDVSFTISESNLTELRRAAYVFGLPDICVYGDKKMITICTTDKKNDTSHTYTFELGPTTKEFCYCLKVENLRILNQDYKVSISNSNVAYFDGGNVRYWIALEP